MGAPTQVDITDIIKMCLFEELTQHKNLPYKRLYDEVIHKYTLLRPYQIVRGWVQEWAQANGKTL